MNIKKGDTVKIIAGNDNGKIGTVISVDPSNNKISNESPLAKAIMKAKVGEVRSVERPNGTYDVEIVEIL